MLERSIIGVAVLDFARRASTSASSASWNRHRSAACAAWTRSTGGGLGPRVVVRDFQVGKTRQ